MPAAPTSRCGRTRCRRRRCSRLLKVCPAHCYELNDNGQVEITVDGCVECGTCRVIGEPGGDIEWNYPRGGYGVLFKFG